MNRSGEHGKTSPARQSRFFERDNYWYYSTREGVDFGPFDTRRDAERGASAFIDFVIHADGSTLDFIKAYRRAA